MLGRPRTGESSKFETIKAVAVELTQVVESNSQLSAKLPDSAWQLCAFDEINVVQPRGRPLSPIPTCHPLVGAKAPHSHSRSPSHIITPILPQVTQSSWINQERGRLGWKVLVKVCVSPRVNLCGALLGSRFPRAHPTHMHTSLYGSWGIMVRLQKGSCLGATRLCIRS